MKRVYKKTFIYALVGVIILSTFSLKVKAEKYEYDSFDRVTKVIYDDGSYVTYTYDNNGNITNTEVHKDSPGDNQGGNNNQGGDNNQSGDNNQGGNDNQGGGNSQGGNGQGGSQNGDNGQGGNGSQNGDNNQSGSGNGEQGNTGDSTGNGGSGENGDNSGSNGSGTTIEGTVNDGSGSGNGSGTGNNSGNQNDDTGNNDSNDGNFIASGTHTTILSKKKNTAGREYIQTIYFSDTYESRFNKVILKKQEKDYHFLQPLSSISNEVVYEIDDEEAPSAVAYIVDSEITEKSVTIGFGGAEDNNGILGYEVYRDGKLLGVTSNTTYTDYLVESDKQYTYTVFAFDNERNKATSSPRRIPYILCF